MPTVQANRTRSRSTSPPCPCGWAGLILAGFAAPTLAASGDIYNLGTLGGLRSFGNAVNNSGQVAGTSSSTIGYNHAFLYTGMPGAGGVMADLASLNFWDSSANAINASGQIAGTNRFALPSVVRTHAFRYTGIPGSGGVMADLGTLGGSESGGSCINDAGQVTGSSFLLGDSAQHAFLYTGTPGSGGAMADLGTLGGGGSFGAAVNASGQVTGSSDYHAFLYTGTPGSGGAMVDLGTLGGFSSQGNAINASGLVAGGSLTGEVVGEDETQIFHAFLYTGTPGSGGAMADLGALGGAMYSEAFAINASGQVVGSSGRAFLYTGTPGVDGQMLDLDAWLDAVNPTEGAKWTLFGANGLSDNGLITGTGRYDDGPGGLDDEIRAFLLDASSVPEPGSFGLIAFCGITLLRRRRVGVRAG